MTSIAHTENIVNAALEYARMGLYVLPLQPGGKLPIPPRGVYDATRDERAVRAWWEAYPDANVGIACGQSGLVVVDFDRADHPLIERLWDAAWAIARTASGLHFYFGDGGRGIGCSSGLLSREGVHVRGRGGYVVAPPSVHPSDVIYEWEREPHGSPEDHHIPDWLVEEMTARRDEQSGAAAVVTFARRRAYALAALRGEAEAVAREPEGNRNNRLNRAAYRLGRMVASGDLSADEVREALTEAALRAGLEIREIERTIASGLRGGARRPWEGPPPTNGQRRTTAPTLGTDAWFAHLLSRTMGDVLTFVPQWGWTVWDGVRWRRSDALALSLVSDGLRDEVFRLADLESDEDRQAKLRGAGVKIQSRARVESVMALARGYMLSEANDFDASETLLNTPTGVVDLRTGELYAHDPAFRLTRCTGVPYGSSDKQPTRFLRFLHEIMDGDAELVGYIRRLLGYALLGRNGERVFVVFWGRGANGKSTLCNILSGVLGTYHQVANPESFETALRGGESPRVDLAVLAGARLVTMNETRQDSALDAALVKKVTGDEDITARFLYRHPFSFRPGFLPVIHTNHKPRFKGGDPALWSRIRLIPFLVQIPPHRQDKHLADTIIRQEGPAVLRWLVEGCLEYHRRGLDEPEKVLASLDEYRREADPIYAFVHECCDVQPTAEAATSDLYEAFVRWWSWAGLEGEPPSVKRFGRELTSMGFGTRKGGRGVRMRVGLKLKD